MGKCKCSIHAAGHGSRPTTYGNHSAAISSKPPDDIVFPIPCIECGDIVKSIEDGIVMDARETHSYFTPGVSAICNTCTEIIQCFICSGKLGYAWKHIKDAVFDDRLPISGLRGMLSEQAMIKLITKVDEWMEEDES